VLGQNNNVCNVLCHKEGNVIAMQTASMLINTINGGGLDDVLSGIYAYKDLDVQKGRYAKIVGMFIDTYGDAKVSLYSVPGRCEICGNHTDHQRGTVIAASVNIDAVAAVAYNDRNEIRILSEGYEMLAVGLSSLEVHDDEAGTSTSLIRGVAAGFLKDGHKVGGFDAYVASDVSSGSGLSSSAVFEVLVGTILSGLYNEMRVDALEIATMSQYAENVYFKKPCGLMDQVACSVGGLVHIDFKDKVNAVVKKIDVEFENFDHGLCIVDTKSSHDDLTDEYASIPSEMVQVARKLGKDVLREIDEDAFYKAIPRLRGELSDRCILRAIHFYEEERRVAEMTLALYMNDFHLFKRLIRKSGDSSFKYLQNIYANTNAGSQGMSLALALSEKFLDDKGASRVHGGGFAGTIEAFVANDYVDVYKIKMDAVFGDGACQVLKIRDVGGVRLV